MCVDGDKARRNSVKGILEVFGIDKNKFYYELKKHRASSIGDGAVVTTSTLDTTSTTTSNEETSSNHSNGDSNAAEQSDGDSNTAEQERNKGGRPRGSTNNEKEKRVDAREKAISWAVQRLNEHVNDPTMIDDSGKWKRGVIQKLAK